MESVSPALKRLGNYSYNVGKYLKDIAAPNITRTIKKYPKSTFALTGLLIARKFVVDAVKKIKTLSKEKIEYGRRVDEYFKSNTLDIRDAITKLNGNYKEIKNLGRELSGGKKINLEEAVKKISKDLLIENKDIEANSTLNKYANYIDILEKKLIDSINKRIRPPTFWETVQRNASQNKIIRWAHGRKATVLWPFIKIASSFIFPSFIGTLGGLSGDAIISAYYLVDDYEKSVKELAWPPENKSHNYEKFNNHDLYAYIMMNQEKIKNILEKAKIKKNDPEHKKLQKRLKKESEKYEKERKLEDENSKKEKVDAAKAFIQKNALYGLSFTKDLAWGLIKDTGIALGWTLPKYTYVNAIRPAAKTILPYAKEITKRLPFIPKFIYNEGLIPALKNIKETANKINNLDKDIFYRIDEEKIPTK